MDTTLLATLGTMTLTTIVWAIRLEAKVKHNQEQLALLNIRVEKDEDKLDTFEKKLMEEMSRVRESLARIEGRIGVTKE